MKKFLIALLIAVLCLSVFPVFAQGEPPVGLAATVVIVAKDATTVTLHAEQTGGDLVTLTLEQACWDSGVSAGYEYVRFVGSIDATFNIGPRTYKGNYLIPDKCEVYVTYYFSSRRAVVPAGVTTLP